VLLGLTGMILIIKIFGAYNATVAFIALYSLFCTFSYEQGSRLRPDSSFPSLFDVDTSTKHWYVVWDYPELQRDLSLVTEPLAFPLHFWIYGPCRL
jgi:hypothetical protein